MNSFQKDMKRIQKLVGSAYSKTGSLLALADGGQLSRKKLEQTLEQTAGFFEKAALEIRQLCERYALGSFSFGRKPSAPLEMPTGHVNLAGCGWVHIQLDTLLPHCRYESPAWLTDTIRYMLTQYMTVTNFPLRFKRMLLVIDEHSSIPGRHVYDQDNKGWKAVSNALKGLVIEDDDQYHLSVVLLSQQSCENVCHISLVLPESAEDFFHMRQKGTAYRALEPSVEVDMKAVYPFLQQCRKTDGSRTGEILDLQGFAGSR